MLFLTRVGFDVSGCHAGNVMLHQQDWCVTVFVNDLKIMLAPVFLNAT